MADQQTDPRIQTFIERLGQLDAGERAQFKRSVGNTLAESHNVMGLFFRILPRDVPAYQEKWYFLVATLYPHASGGEVANFGASLRMATERKPEGSAGLDRRMEALLDADEVQVGHRIGQAIRLLKSVDVPVNWPQLLYDLTYWTHPNRFVQEQWARAYYA